MIGVAALWIIVLLLIGGFALDRVLTSSIVAQFRQPARICPQRDDRRVRNRPRRRSPLQPPAGRPALHRALFGRLFPDQRRRAPTPFRRARCGTAGCASTAEHNDVEVHTYDSRRIRRRAAADRRARCRSCPGREVRWRFQVAQSREIIDQQIRELRSTLTWSFVVLGAGLLDARRRCRRSTACGRCAGSGARSR